MDHASSGGGGSWWPLAGAVGGANMGLGSIWDSVTTGGAVGTTTLSPTEKRWATWAVYGLLAVAALTVVTRILKKIF